MRTTVVLFAAAFLLLLVAQWRTIEPKPTTSQELAKVCPYSSDAEDHQRAPVAFKQTRAPCAPRTLALVLDRSGSMAGAQLEVIRTAIKSLIRTLPEDDQVTLISYGSNARIETPIGPHMALSGLLLNTLDDLEAGGSSNLSLALRAAEQALRFAPTRNRHVILLTDGNANEGWLDPTVLSDFVTRAREQEGLYWSSIGVGEKPHKTLLTRLAAAGGGHYRSAQSAYTLRAALEGIVDHCVERRTELYSKTQP